ncbi:MAG TPA: GNAT family N-acetyltransferase [Nocardioides sp.]|nr:GNAT family N-acetyltransferase [Nocardioides sp.]
MSAPCEIRVGDPNDFAPLVDLQLARVPTTRRGVAELPFLIRDQMSYLALRTAYVDGTLAGWGVTARPAHFAPEMGIMFTVVAPAYTGRGIARTLYDELLPLVPGHITRLGTLVDDQDPVSLEVAQAHGFELKQHGIDSELALVDLPDPTPLPGVDFEDVSDLVFPDEPAVEAMLIASQTNPEAVDAGMISTLENLRGMRASFDPYLAVLARVEGVPAAIITADITDETLYIHYTGVDPAYRGRSIARSLKQFMHLVAAQAGATTSFTTNEESNAGIRRVNADLGYTIVGGMHRLTRVLHAEEPTTLAP